MSERLTGYRKKAILHHGRRCQLCDGEWGGGKEEVHHIDHDRSNNDLDNLMVMCHMCHNAAHSSATSYIDAYLFRRESYPERDAQWRCTIGLDNESVVSEIKDRAESEGIEPETVVEQIVKSELEQ